MALTTESFTSIHATRVSGVQPGNLTPSSSHLLSSRCVLCVESSVALPLGSGEEMHFYCAALFISLHYWWFQFKHPYSKLPSLVHASVSLMIRFDWTSAHTKSYREKLLQSVIWSKRVTRAKWWEGGSPASGWQLPSPWHECFLPKPFRVTL